MSCVAAFCWTLLLSSNMNFIFHHVCLTVHHSANTLESPCQWKILHLLPGNAEVTDEETLLLLGANAITVIRSENMEDALTHIHATSKKTTQRTFRTWCWGKKSLFSYLSAASREMEYYARRLQGTNLC